MLAKSKLLSISLVTLAAAVGVTSYAFTATNTVPTSYAGAGQGTVSGFTVSAIDYTLNATDADDIDEVEFTLTPAPAAGSDVVIEIDGDQYDCTTAAAVATCDTSAGPVDVTGATSLRVVAVN